MSKLKGILLTEGMHGMLSQVEGLAKALDIEFTHHKVELNNLWKLIPSKFTPISQSVYKKINHSDYDLIICLLYTSPSPRDGLLSRMPSSA